MSELSKTIESIRKDFPLISGSNIAYLDNAATTQKPQAVLDAVNKYYQEMNANPFRGVYELSEIATESYENARKAVAQFIGAKDASQIVFTRNATESLNLIAYSYGMNFIKEGDEIVVSVMEHHSNFLPWKQVAEKCGAVLKQLTPDENGEITDKSLEVITDKTRLVAVTQVSNVLGRVNDIKHIAEVAHAWHGVADLSGARPHDPHLQGRGQGPQRQTHAAPGHVRPHDLRHGQQGGRDGSRRGRAEAGRLGRALSLRHRRRLGCRAPLGQGGTPGRRPRGHPLGDRSGRAGGRHGVVETFRRGQSGY